MTLEEEIKQFMTTMNIKIYNMLDHLVDEETTDEDYAHVLGVMLQYYTESKERLEGLFKKLNESKQDK